MLSFEISAIDIVLLIAVLVLLVLFVSQRKGQSVSKPRLNMNDQEELPARPKTKAKTASETLNEEQSSEGFQKCVHQFGYLRGMPKNTSIPDECFGCPKVLRCMFPTQ